MRLLGTNAKTLKSEELFPQWRVRVMHLAPAKVSGHEVCPERSPGCTAACLNRSGQGNMGVVQEARIAKTKLYFEDHTRFMLQLAWELTAEARRARKRGQRLAVRLNGTSDLDWVATIRDHPHIQFYDYTKVWDRMTDWVAGGLPKNYYLTWSASEDNWPECSVVLEHGGTVALVREKGAPLPWWARERGTINGDRHDLRFKDKPRSVVLLKPKGRAKRDRSGFVVRRESNV